MDRKKVKLFPLLICLSVKGIDFIFFLLPEQMRKTMQ